MTSRERILPKDLATARVTPAAQRKPSDTGEHAAGPLPDAVRSVVEPLFERDFADIRIHDDATSHAQAASLDAHAFTAGRDIHFGVGQYRPGERGGLHLIAHELAHAIQQTGGSTPATSTARSGGDALEHEADVAADRIAQGQSARVTPSAAAVGVQRKPRRYSARFDEGHAVVAENLAKFRPLYVRWRSELTEVIVAKCGAVADPLHDYRFVLMLAQRMVEQDGPREKAAGNNPYNVMGPGDPDVDRSQLNQSGKNPEKHPYEFWRPDNVEVVEGERKKVPAWFAAYKTEMSGQKAFLVMLEKRWPKAYAAIASGASADEYVDGLFPDKRKFPRGNFATASFKDYLNGVRLRARHVVGDLRRVYSAYLAEAQARLKNNPPSQTPPEVAGQPELDQLGVALITAELQELDDLTDRIVEGKPVIRPQQATTP